MVVLNTQQKNNTLKLLKFDCNSLVVKTDQLNIEHLKYEGPCRILVQLVGGVIFINSTDEYFTYRTFTSSVCGVELVRR